MSALATRAELIKLARDFQRDVGELESLAGLGVDRLMRLRHLCSDQLFRRYQPMYRRVAAASALVPARLAVTLGERIFGPYLGGRIGSQLETDRAIKFAQLASVEFLAEICETIDPRRVLPIIHAMPLDRVVAVGRILLGSRDYITMGKFVDAVTDVQVQAMLEVIDDPEVLLHTAFYTEGKERLESIMAMIDDERLKGVILHSVGSGHFPEALALMGHVGEESERRLVNLSADLGEPVLAELVRVADSEGLWGEILPLVMRMTPENMARVMAVEALRDRAVLGRLMLEIHAQSAWDEVIPLFAQTNEVLRESLIQVECLYRPEIMWSMFQSVLRTGSQEMLFSMLEMMSAEEKSSALSAVFHAVNEARLHDVLFQMLQQVSREDQELLVAASIHVEAALLREMLQEARRYPGASDTWLFKQMDQQLAGTP